MNIVLNFGFMFFGAGLLDVLPFLPDIDDKLN
jgi:hypothetical protein